MNRFGYDVYAPPTPARGRPAVIALFRVYSAAMIVAYAGLIVVLLEGSVWPAAVAHTRPVPVAAVAIAALVAIIHAAGALVPFKPWGWTLGLIVICVGLTSCAAMVSIPLLIFWLKPMTKAAFGRL